MKLSNTPMDVPDSPSAVRDRLRAGLRPHPMPPLPAEPLVSILVANYNYARYLPETIGSVLAQTYPRWELCVCDDGSSDDSLEVIRRFAANEPRIKLLAQRNAGFASALNGAMSLATGDIVALLDADDVWLATKLAKTVEAYRNHPAAGFVAHGVAFAGSDLTVFKRQFPLRTSEGWLGPDIIAGYPCVFPPCSGLTVRRVVADKIFPVPADFRVGVDSLVREHAALISETAAVNEPLAIYRIHDRNLTGLGTLTLDYVNTTIDFRERLYALRLEFLEREQGLTGIPDRCRLRESAHLYLLRAFLEQRAPEPFLLESVGLLERIAWKLASSLPHALAMRLLTIYRGRTGYLKPLMRFANRMRSAQSYLPQAAPRRV